MAIHEVQYDSYNQKDKIKGWIYTPIRKPKGIVQLVHGFGEHSRRYLHMIIALNEAGFVVAAGDHVGHGKTAYDSGNWSDWGDQGYTTMAEDEYKLREIVQQQYSDLPFFMFGHSMGSMIVRIHASKYGTGIEGLILCGTSGNFPHAKEIGEKLKVDIDNGKGEQVNADYLDSLLGWMTDRIDYPLTQNDWICGDPDVVADHANDPFNNFTSPPNIRSLYQFVQMMQNIVGKEWAEKIPRTVPIYNIAGDQDPVGQYGEGVYAVSNWLAETGHQVKTKLYSGYRHEIHNYRDIRDEVEEGIIEFLNEIAE
ncbi:alpha/beta fold hydrolase [Gracilibacillus suaedae]|uniref:alpha/beta fold hydrolase n=1 Tax=Gracilibacillus suaedae TaxID=2820273 RepID=UPI001ABE80B5|nr:alpha/beta fold hydrolase [Gracilibacillus suaedae]